MQPLLSRYFIYSLVINCLFIISYPLYSGFDGGLSDVEMSDKEAQVDRSQSTIADETAVKLMRNMYLTEPIFATYQYYDDNSYIFTYFDYRFIVHKEFAGTWQVIFSEDRIVSHFDHFDVKKSENDLVFFFLITDSGSAMGSAVYYAYTLKEKKLYSIFTSGYHGHFNEIRIPDDLKNNRPDILSYLEAKIMSSGYTHIPDEKDLDFDLPFNANKEWLIQNQNIHNSLRRARNRWLSINSKRFNTDNTDDYFRGNTSSKDVYENDNYLIAAYFKSFVVAYDKTDKSSFVLWVPDDMYHWVTKIVFVGDHIIEVNDHGFRRYRFALDELKVMRPR